MIRKNCRCRILFKFFFFSFFYSTKFQAGYLDLNSNLLPESKVKTEKIASRWSANKVCFYGGMWVWCKGTESWAHYNILPLLSPSKWSPCSLRFQQEPGDLADGNMCGHLVDRPAPFHLPKQRITLIMGVYCLMPSITFFRQFFWFSKIWIG